MLTMVAIIVGRALWVKRGSIIKAVVLLVVVVSGVIVETRWSSR